MGASCAKVIRKSHATLLHCPWYKPFGCNLRELKLFGPSLGGALHGKTSITGLGRLFLEGSQEGNIELSDQSFGFYGWRKIRGFLMGSKLQLRGIKTSGSKLYSFGRIPLCLILFIL